jgi:ketosteroid isomerase-like protein
MQESRNVQITRQVIQAVNDYRFDAILDLATDDIVVLQPFAAVGQPERYRGREAFVNGLRFIPTLFRSFKLEISAVYDCPEDNAVAFEQSSRGIFNVDGSEYTNLYMMIFRFRCGKVSEWVEHYDPRRMTEALTPILAKMSGAR